MNIKLIYYLLLICFFSISCSPSTETENIDIDTDIDPVLSTKANILLLIADDFGKDATPNYPEGSIKPNMPNLVY